MTRAIQMGLIAAMLAVYGGTCGCGDTAALDAGPDVQPDAVVDAGVDSDMPDIRCAYVGNESGRCMVSWCCGPHSTSCIGGECWQCDVVDIRDCTNYEDIRDLPQTECPHINTPVEEFLMLSPEERCGEP